jgi:hypothetical protein
VLALALPRASARASAGHSAAVLTGLEHNHKRWLTVARAFVLLTSCNDRFRSCALAWSTTVDGGCGSMFALKLDVRACTRLLSVAAADRRSPLLLPGARCCCCTPLRCCCCTALCCSAAAPLLSGRGGRLSAAALVGDRYAVRFLGAAPCEAAAAFESLPVLLATWIFAPPQAGEKDERRFEKRNLCSRVPRLRVHVTVFWSHAKSRAVLGGTLGENAAWCSGHGSSVQADGCGLSPAAGPARHVVLCGHRSVFSSPPGRRNVSPPRIFSTNPHLVNITS